MSLATLYASPPMLPLDILRNAQHRFAYYIVSFRHTRVECFIEDVPWVWKYACEHWQLKTLHPSSSPIGDIVNYQALVGAPIGIWHTSLWGRNQKVTFCRWGIKWDFHVPIVTSCFPGQCYESWLMYANLANVSSRLYTCKDNDHQAHLLIYLKDLPPYSMSERVPLGTSRAMLLWLVPQCTTCTSFDHCQICVDWTWVRWRIVLHAEDLGTSSSHTHWYNNLSPLRTLITYTLTITIWSEQDINLVIVI